LNELRDFLSNSEYTKSLTHIDLSGMSFPKEDLLNICENLSTECYNLSSIHLSDNGINFEEGFKNDVLEIFNIFEEIEVKDMFNLIKAATT
jgi:Ran GTPase-activating protein (RanGAP) involved in mRNA processing and transport